MIDIETLGTGINAPILTIGAVVFDTNSPKIGDKLYLKIKVEDYNKYHQFKVDYSTIVWWNKQTESARKEAFLSEPRVSLEVAMMTLHSWLVNLASPNSKLIMWSHGKEFDLPILQFAFETVGLNTPWKFWETRDTRTVYDIFKVDLKNVKVPESLNLESASADKRPFDLHHALGDCYRQIIGVQQAMSKMK